MQIKLVEKKITQGNEEEFYKQINKDITQVIIQFLSERGHGKSTSLKTIVKYCMERHPEIVFKAFDPSQTWYHIAPLKYRQLVTRDRINNNEIANVDNCVYELGGLTEPERRAFVGTVIAQDYSRAYNLKLNDPRGFEALPFVIYIVEESNVIFGSYSFRRNDKISPMLQDFVSVGRNYKLGAFLVATAEDGEMAPSLRRRSRRIYGRVEAEGDLARVRRKDKELAKQLTVMPRYNFVYVSENVYGPVKVPNVVTETPVDYIHIPAEGVNQPSSFNRAWWIEFLGAAIILFMMFLYFAERFI